MPLNEVRTNGGEKSMEKIILFLIKTIFFKKKNEVQIKSQSRAWNASGVSCITVEKHVRKLKKFNENWIFGEKKRTQKQFQ